MAQPGDISIVAQEDLVAGFRRLGLAAGDGVMVHSSLRSFGHVVGGAETVIRALMAVVGEQGGLMMPSFNHGHCVAPGQPGYFDPLATPTTNGAIPDRFWRMEGVQRSWAPTHAFAAWGKNAVRYTQWHHRTQTCGADSPLGLLAADGGYGLLLGATFDSNTYHHVVETVVAVPCLGQRTESIPMKLPDGRMVEGRSWTWREARCPLNATGRYVQVMESRGMLRQTIIGDCRAMLISLPDCHEVVARTLCEGIDNIPPFRQCPIRPRPTERTVASDWDPPHQCLLPNSPALKY